MKVLYVDIFNLFYNFRVPYKQLTYSVLALLFLSGCTAIPKKTTIAHVREHKAP